MQKFVILIGRTPFTRFGFEKFCQYCADAPVDGLILPDLPGTI